MASKTKTAHKHETHKSNATMAKSLDGTVQFTFKIAWSEVEPEMKHVAEEMGKTLEIPGFRKGKAPLEQVLTHISREKLIEHTLRHLLPELFSKAVEEHNIKPIIYPRFELLKVEENSDWEIRATTCEMPQINLGNYKEEVKGALSSKSIWTPEKGDEKPKESTREEKEQIAIDILTKSVEFPIPAVLIHEEVESRLSNLLSRLEKLGLSLEAYLSSIKKTSDEIKSEYEGQAKDAIKLDFLLNQIAFDEKISVTAEEVNVFIEAAKSDPQLSEKLNTPEQRRIIETILVKRKVLDSLISL